MNKIIALCIILIAVIYINRVDGACTHYLCRSKVETLPEANQNLGEGDVDGDVEVEPNMQTEVEQEPGDWDIKLQRLFQALKRIQ